LPVSFIQNAPNLDFHSVSAIAVAEVVLDSFPDGFVGFAAGGVNQNILDAARIKGFIQRPRRDVARIELPSQRHWRMWARLLSSFRFMGTK
jgi:hypothetical protein